MSSKSEIKLRAIEEKGGHCVLCGYKQCAHALHFHHINPFEKNYKISQCNTWEEVEKELSKCVLVCANCHAEIHAGFIDHEILIELAEI